MSVQSLLLSHRQTERELAALHAQVESDAALKEESARQGEEMKDVLMRAQTEVLVCRHKVKAASDLREDALDRAKGYEELLEQDEELKARYAALLEETRRRE